MQVCRFPGFGFPDQLRCVLKYKENGISFTGSLTPAAQVYRLNSLFDPNLTGVGHQPNNFNQLTAMYSQYVVTAARLTAQVMNEGTVEADCVICYTDVNTSTQTVENLAESRWSKNICAGQVNSGTSVKTFTPGVVLIPMLMGERDLNTDPNTYANVGANPADPAYAIFKLASADGVTNTKVIVNFQMEFDCTFKELTPVAES